MIVNRYPYTDQHELNLDWILRQIYKFREELSSFVALNKIKYDGIWNIEKAYEVNTIVWDNNGMGYISVKAVPYGINISNTDYWKPVLEKPFVMIPQMYGAKADGITDDTEAIQECLSVNKYVFFPAGTYIVSDAILLNTATTVVGEKGLSYIKGTKPAVPVFKNATPASGNVEYTLKDLNFVSVGDRTAYTVDFENAYLINVDSCKFTKEGTSSVSSKYGLAIRRGAGTVPNFVNRIQNCNFSSASIVLEATDCYILNNEVWGDGREFAISLSGCDNTIIDGNQIVGGSVYGAIHMSGTNKHLRIVNNYFDGSYDALDSLDGINANTIENCIISNNNFWKQKRAGIYTVDMRDTIISNNTFFECNYYESYNVADIEMTASTGSGSYNNTITGNKFYRSEYLVDVGGTLTRQARSTSVKAPTLKLYSATGFPKTIIENNSASWEQYYDYLSVNDYQSFKVNCNTSRMFGYNLDESMPAANYKAQTGQVLDLDASNYDNYTIYLDDTTSFDNAPSGTGQYYYVEYRKYLDGYCEQIYRRNTTGHTYIKRRECSNGVWGSLEVIST